MILQVIDYYYNHPRINMDQRRAPPLLLKLGLGPPLLLLKPPGPPLLNDPPLCWGLPLKPPAPPYLGGPFGRGACGLVKRSLESKSSGVM